MFACKSRVLASPPGLDYGFGGGFGQVGSSGVGGGVGHGGYGGYYIAPAYDVLLMASDMNDYFNKKKK